MANFIKGMVRETLITLHLDLTKNLKYDRLTRKILKDYLKPNFNCIDIGCHKGEILDIMLKYSGNGNHWAFEPIPDLFSKLKSNYIDGKVNVFPYALSDKTGSTTFNLVKNAPAYSGIKQRRYDIENPEIEKINVELARLDDLISSDVQINFVKIDVEGGELDVIKGGTNMLKSSKPLILFEFGKGASDYYGTTPQDMYDLLVDNIGLNIFTLKDFVNKKEKLSLEKFQEHFDTNSEYYFVAHSH